MIKAINKLMKVVEFIVTALLAATVIIVIMQIVWRYVLKSPLGWTDQMARFGFMWIIMLGIPVMFNKNIMMSFDLVIDSIKGKSHYVVQIIIRIIGVAFCICYAIFVIDLCKQTGPALFPGVKIPYNSLYAAQPCCGFLLAIVFIKQIAECILEIKKINKEEKK